MNKVVHFEIPADDVDRAKKFYSETFGWQLSDWPMDDGTTYIGATTTETDPTTHVPKEAGSINGGIVKRNEYAKTPQVTINVPSIDEFVGKIRKNGGKLVKDKTDVGGMGFYAYVNDSEGNLVGLWEDAKK
jgi:predicted enzyme related to lactoylglutathione lyase